MVTLMLVRHGATEWSRFRRFLGWRDLPLSAAGRSQAAALRQSLSHYTFAGVWSSDLTRSVETARIAWGEPQLDSRLREIDFGEIEGEIWEDLASDIQQALLTFTDFVAPGGESVGSLLERLSSFLSELEPGAHLCFTHGGVIRLLTRLVGPERLLAPAETVTIEWTPEAAANLASGRLA